MAKFSVFPLQSSARNFHLEVSFAFPIDETRPKFSLSSFLSQFLSAISNPRGRNNEKERDVIDFPLSASTIAELTPTTGEAFLV
jgi:hypothetical protein